MSRVFICIFSLFALGRLELVFLPVFMLLPVLREIFFGDSIEEEGETDDDFSASFRFSFLVIGVLGGSNTTMVVTGADGAADNSTVSNNDLISTTSS